MNVEDYPPALLPLELSFLGEPQPWTHNSSHAIWGCRTCPPSSRNYSCYMSQIQLTCHCPHGLGQTHDGSPGSVRGSHLHLRPPLMGTLFPHWNPFGSHMGHTGIITLHGVCGPSPLKPPPYVFQQGTLPPLRPAP